MQDYASQLASLQQQLLNLQKLGSNPTQLLQQVLSGGPVGHQPEQTAATQEAMAQQSSLSKQQETLLAFYDEFALTDDGRALAASLSKFARYVQSKTGKAAQ